VDNTLTALVMTSKELSSNGSLGFKFKSCTAYSVRTYKENNLMNVLLSSLIERS
jgi:hypothetical protein